MFPNWQTAILSESSRNWTPFSIASTSEGLTLSNAILRTVPHIDLKSLGMELRTRFDLIGESAVWISTRAKDPTDMDAVICKVSKDRESQRIFVTLGSNLDTAQDFMFFRKQEIPESSKFLISPNDSSDIKLTYNDNGDSYISVTVSVNDDPDREVTMTCNKFVPKLTATPVCIAASGDLVRFKFVGLKYVERLSGAQAKSTHHEECCNLL